jgi:hypothetical protein
MVLYCTYYIQFCLNGETETQTKRYRACSPGEAFQKCHRRFPGSQLIQGWRQSERNGEHAITHYVAPSTISIAAGPKIVWEQTSFGFANQLSFKPINCAPYWSANNNLGAQPTEEN